MLWCTFAWVEKCEVTARQFEKADDTARHRHGLKRCPDVLIAVHMTSVCQGLRAVAPMAFMSDSTCAAAVRRLGRQSCKCQRPGFLSPQRWLLP